MLELVDDEHFIPFLGYLSVFEGARVTWGWDNWLELALVSQCLDEKYCWDHVYISGHF